MNCWCGGELSNSFNKEYYRCSSCGTFTSKNKTPDNFYDFVNFWYKRQEEIKFPLKHPDKIERFKKADIYTLRYYL